MPVYVNEACHADPIIASSEAAGLMVKPFEQARDRHLGAAIENAPTDQSAIKAWIAEIYAKYKPKAVVSAERLGAGADGNVHTATGLPLTGPKSLFEGCIDIGAVVTEANKRKIFSVGIGDHGNELGFGHDLQDGGQDHAQGQGTGDRGEDRHRHSGDDVQLGLLRNRSLPCLSPAQARARHSPEMEKRIVQACLDAGGLEAMYCTTEFLVDGLDGETSMACMQFLSNIVRKNLEPPERRADALARGWIEPWTSPLTSPTIPRPTPAQLALIGRHIDRLVTVEARISPTSRNVIVNLYEAACAAQGGGPLSMLAAQQIVKHLGPGKTVFLTTGAGDPRFLPAGETDGPPGVAALALAIHAATGAMPLLFTEEPSATTSRPRPWPSGWASASPRSRSPPATPRPCCRSLPMARRKSRPRTISTPTSRPW